jgi:hypothetical protein
MPTPLQRIARLEEALEKHLIESGGIKSDLQWLKSVAKARMIAEMSLLVTVAGALITYLLRH